MKKPQGKLILVKCGQDGFYLLIPATALAFSLGLVTIDRELLVDNTMTNQIPAELCYPFDPTIMELVNSLTGSATDKISAARQILDSLQNVKIEFTNLDVGERTH